jgi:hypothetical protein
MLRRPGTKGPRDMRTDPFWEFGSFGLTGCHAKNIMHPKNAKSLESNALAFVQGGPNAIKLIFITPPVRLLVHRKRCEATWPAAHSPFRYADAPLIIDNGGDTDFPLLKNLVSGVARITWMGKIASAFRTRVRPLPDDVARELAHVYRSYQKTRHKTIEAYTDALPFLPPIIDDHRESTYFKLLARA